MYSLKRLGGLRMKKFWKWLVVMIAWHCEWLNTTSFENDYDSKLIFCIFCHNKNYTECLLNLSIFWLQRVGWAFIQQLWFPIGWVLLLGTGVHSLVLEWLVCGLSGLPWEGPKVELEVTTGLLSWWDVIAWVIACVEPSTIAEIKDGLNEYDLWP
jgi:hypothetical protein